MSALLLRIIACVAMLIDHIGFDLNYLPMRAVGRIAFPIFVFLICNGYRHTGNRLRYLGRLLLFAILSQIPFSLFCTNTLTHTTGNVFITLLMALICIWAADELWRNTIGRWFCLIPAFFVCVLYLLGYLRSDYGARGIVIAMIYWLFDGKEIWKRILMTLASFCAVFYDYIVQTLVLALKGGGFCLPAVSRWGWMQLFSLLALPLIFMYNGKKGTFPGKPFVAKLMQYGFYLFYPLHMLVIWLLRNI